MIVLAAGCERIDVPPPTQAENLQNAPIESPSFTRGDARLSVAHMGIRRLEFPLVSGPGNSFRERITTDGHGRYSIEPLDAKAGSIAEWEAFMLTQRGREGFLFRYRDFLVRDPRLFARNWRATDEGRRVVVAGRSSALYRVEHLEGAHTVFELSVDAGTGLILASQELDAGGHVVAAMTYESVQLDPDVSQVAWHVPANEEVVLDPSREQGPEGPDGEILAKTLRPRLLPHGYGPLEEAMVGDGRGGKWLKLSYTDGVEPLFFFQGLAARPKGVKAGAQVRAETASPEKSSVVVFEVGAATAVQGKVDGFDLMVIGKAPQAELLDMVESALP